eukprot:CAMPEP_0119547534 /NCGR_PEP_ID=MMETSP1352-20130426/1632_1 /TAXON_ID=265584 /ORGANISM="Stauroneis constricta, Strain CCMP1120" /LENGTH=431 /DNA_ID=CAMNT_0007592481 /DNA_START=77 /DNA_END=1372 /DNA_ORIENTATION=-
MVEINTIPDDADASATTTDKPNETKKNDDGWKELMGQDMLLKILSSNKDATDKEELEHGDTVLINLIARIAPDSSSSIDDDDKIIQKVNGWLIGIGDTDVLPAIEMGIRFMQVGQTGRIWSNAKYAWGPGRRTYGKSVVLEPNTNVMFDITITQRVVDTSRLNPYFPIQRAITRKAIANDIFEHEFSSNTNLQEQQNENSMSIPRALRLYKKVTEDMTTLSNGTYFAQQPDDHPQRKQVQQLIVDCWNNISVVEMKQGNYHAAKEACVKVLEQNSKHIKALLRVSRACLLDSSSTMEEAKAALDAASAEITYKNPIEEKELKRLMVLYKKKMQEYKQQSKAMFGNKLLASKKSSDDNNTDKSKSDELTELKDVSQASRALAGGGKQQQDDGGIFNKTNQFLLAFQLVLPIMMYALYTFMKFKPMEETNEEL